MIITAYGTVEHAVEALRLGANDFLVKPFDPDSLGLLLAKLMAHKKLLEEAQYLRSEATKSWAGEGDIIGTTPAMIELFSTIREVAPNESSVSHPRRDGHGQGAYRSRDPREQQENGRTFRPHQLWSDSRVSH